MKLNDKKKRLIAELALLLCGIVWGSGFVVMKSTLNYLPVNYLLAIRFFMASFIMLLFLRSRVTRASRDTLVGGGLAGLAIYLAFFLQTIGLKTTTAGNNAFLTAIYVVLVPFVQWIVSKKKPSLNAVVAGVLCLTGVGIIALNNNLTVAVGDFLTLIGGIFFAVHIVIIARFTEKGADTAAMTCLQFFVSSLCAGVVMLISETPPAAEILFSSQVVFSLLYLVGFCTLYAMVAQNIALKYAPASHASLLMGTEAPFGCLFGILLLGEPFTMRFLLGAALIAVSIVLSELGGKKKAAELPLE